MKARRRNRKQHGLNLLPLIDIIFQLVLFFLVSSSFALVPAVHLNFPASSAAQASRLDGIVIHVDSDGKILFDGNSVASDKLGLCLMDCVRKGRNPENTSVVVEADASVPNGYIVQVFDELRNAGFYSVSLRTAE